MKLTIKPFVFLALLFSFLLFSSADTVAEKPEDGETKLETTDQETNEAVGEAKYWCYRGCCGYRTRYGCSRCCRPGEVPSRVEGSTEESNYDDVKYQDNAYGRGGGWGYGGGGRGGGGYGGGGRGGGGYGGGGRGGGGYGGGGGRGGGGYGGGGGRGGGGYGRGGGGP